jgi:hypothetical protein
MAFKRQKLTEAVMAAAEGIAPVGLLQAPNNSGWDSKATGSAGAKFRPFSVLVPGMATLQAQQSFGLDENDWRCTYTVSSYGVSVTQAEQIADDVRNVIEAMTGASVTLEGSYSVQQVRVSVIGAVQVVNSAEPPYYFQTDTYEVWVTKEIGF